MFEVMTTGADGPLHPAVRGDGQLDSHVAVGIRTDGHLPANVAAADQPPGPGHRASRHREDVVLQRLVAEVCLKLLAEGDPEFEVVAAVVGRRDAFETCRQRRPLDGEFQRDGQHRPVSSADGPLRVAVLGGGQLDGDVRVGVRFDGDLPPDVGVSLSPSICRAPATVPPFTVNAWSRSVKELKPSLGSSLKRSSKVKSSCPSCDSGASWMAAVRGEGAEATVAVAVLVSVSC